MMRKSWVLAIALVAVCAVLIPTTSVASDYYDDSVYKDCMKRGAQKYEACLKQCGMSRICADRCEDERKLWEEYCHRVGNCIHRYRNCIKLAKTHTDKAKCQDDYDRCNKAKR